MTAAAMLAVLMNLLLGCGACMKGRWATGCGMGPRVGERCRSVAAEAVRYMHQSEGRRSHKMSNA